MSTIRQQIKEREEQIASLETEIEALSTALEIVEGLNTKPKRSRKKKTVVSPVGLDQRAMIVFDRDPSAKWEADRLRKAMNAIEPRAQYAKPSISASLSKLAKKGKIVRIAPGVYSKTAQQRT